MKTMTVTWVKATRCQQEKERLELAARNLILDRCNGVDNAHRAFLAFQAAHQDPTSDWSRFYRQAIDEAASGLTPTERRSVGLIVKFE